MTQTAPASDLVVVRAYAGPVELEGDGRTIVGRCIPYDLPALVCEPGGIPYREVWRAGSFRTVVRDPGRVLLNYEHRDGLLDQIGPAVELEERADDGLFGTFRALPSASGDQALELVRSGAVTGLSVAAVVSLRHSKTLEDGTVERTFAKRLEHVALTAIPAFRDAQVTTVRSGAGVDDDARIAEVRAWRDRAALRFPRER